MRRSDLDKKRIDPCISEIYNNSECVVKGFPKITLEKFIRILPYFHDGKIHKCTPLNCFWMDGDRQLAIVNKWCKGLHHFWYYTPKLNFKDPDYDAKVKELHDFRDFESRVLKDKTLTYAQRKAKIKKEALAHHFIKRSIDAEYVSFNSWNISPTSNAESFKKATVIYAYLEDAYYSGRLNIEYRDLTNTGPIQFERNNYLVKVENVEYVWNKNSKEYIATDSKEVHWNTYDLENHHFVRCIYDPSDLIARIAADSFEEAYNAALKYLETVDGVDKTDRRYTQLVKECLSVLIVMIGHRIMTDAGIPEN